MSWRVTSVTFSAGYPKPFRAIARWRQPGMAGPLYIRSGDGDTAKEAREAALAKCAADTEWPGVLHDDARQLRHE